MKHFQYGVVLVLRTSVDEISREKLASTQNQQLSWPENQISGNWMTI